MTRCLVALSALTIAAVINGAASGDEDPEEPRPPTVQAVIVAEPPVIDGKLDDACWAMATNVDGFWRERCDLPPLEKTQAWICCDSENIYVAFRCDDSQACDIRCQQRKRQGNMSDDDRVSLALDVEDAGHNRYYFTVNAAGTQSDSVPGGTSEKIEWKGDWQAASRKDEQGWSAEMAIPFSILRYPPGQECFRFSLSRYLAREEDWVTYPRSLALKYDPDRYARLHGICTPPTPFRWVLMPYALTVLSEDDQEREPLTAGLNFKGTFPNGVVGLFTYNPDFRNIEDVVETIDFTYVERYLSDYRPFFQEGNSFAPESRVFYTRRIEKVDIGAKTFGTVGSHRFYLLDTYRRGGENHLAWNYTHLLGTRGGITFGGVDRNVPSEPDNEAYLLATDRVWRFPGGGRYAHAEWFGSQTQGEGGDGNSYRIGATEWRNQGIAWFAQYDAVGEDYRADDGYVPETGVREFGIGFDGYFPHEKGSILSTRWSVHTHGGKSDLGRRPRIWAEHIWTWRNGNYVNIGGTRGERDGLGLASNYLELGWKSRDMYRRGAILGNWGERYGEPYQFHSINQAFKLSQCWFGEVSLERVYVASLDDEDNVMPPQWSRQAVLTTTYDISPEQTVSARLVHSDGSTNAYAAYRQRVRKGMDLLIVAGDPNADEWVSRLAVKAIWCF